jgi:hypothetical protein
VSTLLHATVYMFLHNLLNVLLQIANKMGLQKNICVYSFQVCYTRFGAYPNHMHITIIVKKKKKEKHNSTDMGLMLGLADLVPDCWL